LALLNVQATNRQISAPTLPGQHPPWTWWCIHEQTGARHSWVFKSYQLLDLAGFELWRPAAKIFWSWPCMTTMSTYILTAASTTITAVRAFVLDNSIVHASTYCSFEPSFYW